MTSVSPPISSGLALNGLHCPAGEVHVWCARVSAWQHVEPWLGAVLDPQELARSRRFRFLRDRQQFVVAHGLLRHLLGRYLTREPATVQYDHGPVGKPCLAAPMTNASLRFNLAHSGDVVLIAIADGADVGVDVEQWSTDIEGESLAEYFFSPSERTQLAAAPRARQVEDFFTCWCRKEAYIKATGLGVSQGLDYFDVVVSARRTPQLISDRRTGDDARRWQFMDILTVSGYSAALAIAGTGRRIRSRRLEPGDQFPVNRATS